MRLLITGATGFAGNALLDQIARSPHYERLSILVLPGDPGLARVHAKKIPGLEVIEGDVADADSVRRAVDGHTHVLHMAGLISYWGRDLEKLRRVNCLGARNVAEACADAGVRRLVHVSSVGAVGFYKDGRLADEDTPYNWPQTFHYMTTKHEGQLEVERVVKTRGLPAVILNPASLMGPGDPDPRSAHNQIYTSIYGGPLFGCFAGGLAVTDVRDLTSIALAALTRGQPGRGYLVIGSNVTYVEVVRAIGTCLHRPVYPWRVPSFLLTAGGAVLEAASAVTNRKPLLTMSYGQLSGWYSYYSNRRSVEAFGHAYIPFATTIADGCAWYVREHAPKGRK